MIVHGVLGVAAPFAVRYDAGLERARTEELLQATAMAILRQTLADPLTRSARAGVRCRGAAPRWPAGAGAGPSTAVITMGWSRPMSVSSSSPLL